MSFRDRLLQALPAAALAAVRLWIRRDPLDWLFVLTLFCVFLPFCTQPRARNALLTVAVLSLTALYLNAHMSHLLAVNGLLP